uniref:PUM-HD domain-containing protein n=1 Tax=Globodera rostochiensis TaxID=31243 RepID=A0A914I315_GLORO
MFCSITILKKAKPKNLWAIGALIAMVNARFIRNFLNGQQHIHKIRQVQTVRLTFLHQCIKNECPPAAVLSLGARMASSNRPSHRSKLSDEYSNNGGSKLLDEYHNHRAANLQLTDLGKDTVAFALDPRGSRALQLGHCTEQQKRHVLEQLHGSVLSLVTDKYGSFVIRHVIEHGLPEGRDSIVRNLHKNITSLSLHECGCRVVKHILDHCTEQQKRPVLEQLHENVLSLVTDQYGTHVIQHLIEHGLPEDRERITRSLQGDIMKNAHPKDICNIINKFFDFWDAGADKCADRSSLCADNGFGSPPLLKMMQRPFGNKVVLRMLDVADSARRQKMMLVIKTAPIKNTGKRSSK